MRSANSYSDLPLEGVTVVEVATLVPGPLAGMVLADLGAFVVKVESPPRGDPMRHLRPDGFEVLNRNKFGISLDLTNEVARGQLKDILRVADGLIVATRPTSRVKLGLDYDSVLRLNPGILYCSVTGYGETGPYSEWYGHDINFVGVAAGLEGSPGDVTFGSTRFPIADVVSGLYCAISFLAALGKAANRGVHVDLAISEAALIGPMILQDGANAGAQHQTQRTAKVPGYSVYRCADGRPISVGCRDEQSWYRLCENLGVTELAGRAELADWRSRMRHPDVERALSVEFARHARGYWLSLLPPAGVSVAPVNDYDDLLADPQMRYRSSVNAEFGTESVARVLLPAYPAMWNGRRFESRMPAPNLGQDNEQVFRMLGMR